MTRRIGHLWRQTYCAFIPWALLFGATLSVSAEEAKGTKPAKDANGFAPLLNGKDLTGWVPVNTAPSTWSVRDGMLICSGKPIGELRTQRMYQNFILEVEWRHMRPKGNAGIFVWADDITARGQPFHRSIEVQVLENAYGNTRSYSTHGDIFPIHGAKMTPINGRGGSRAFPTEERSRPSPEWNHYRIECRDGEISLAVNGKIVTRGKDCSPRKGYICIESEGGIVHYRNMRLKELPPSPVKPEDVAIADRGYRSLYTGVDLSGWKTSPADSMRWVPRDWNLVHEKTNDDAVRSTLTSEESFGDFGFILDVQIRENTAPAQLQLRGSEDAVIPLVPEDERWRKHLLKGRGWNRFEGTLEGKALRVTLNGHEVLAKTFASLPTRGPLRIAANGRLVLANFYVRELTRRASSK